MSFNSIKISIRNKTLTVTINNFIRNKIGSMKEAEIGEPEAIDNKEIYNMKIHQKLSWDKIGRLREERQSTHRRMITILNLRTVRRRGSLSGKRDVIDKRDKTGR